jgi:multidrug efflux system membrane fusion protein
VNRYLASGPLKVEAVIPGDEGGGGMRAEEAPPPVQGFLTFVDNAVDKTTGTVRLKATFENRDSRLWPGQFVDVFLTLAVESEAIVVPSHALQASQTGQLVFVVRADSAVEVRPVVAARSLGGETVVRSGLKPGEIVVVDGQMRCIDGTKVEVKEDDAGTEVDASPEATSDPQESAASVDASGKEAGPGLKADPGPGAVPGSKARP